MSSWFASLKESATAVANSAVKATEQVVSHVHLDPDMLQKLTLTSPELQAERQRIDAEERRKEAVRDKLAGLLPWETRDPERDILVEECKQVILALSSDPLTFTGPWEMPEMKVAAHHISPSHSQESKEEQDGEDKEASPPPAVTPKTPKPTSEALEKLSKLEPLPNLLGVDFDLDSHVGLIQRLLKLDPVLVKAQGNLSGGGDREKVFWHNYFFHCAYSRYEAGLSVDEVWSETDVQQRNTIDAEKKAADKLQEKQAKQAMIQNVMKTVLGAAGTAAATKANDPEPAKQSEDHEHEITFGGEHDGAAHKEQSGTPAKAAAEEEDEVEAVLRELQEEQQPQLSQDNPPKSSSPSSEYEMVEEGDKDETTGEKDTKEEGDNDIDYEDPELDELEAEIARELED